MPQSVQPLVVTPLDSGELVKHLKIEPTPEVLCTSASVEVWPLKVEVTKDDTITSVTLLVVSTLVLYLGVRVIKRLV